MDFLVDENLPTEVANQLTRAGHAAITVFDRRLSGQADPRVAELCKAERRALIRLDVDFANTLLYPPDEYFGLVVLRLDRQDHCVEQTFIKPGHAWTNGRIERLFRTVKETARRLARVFISKRHLRSFCDDFTAYYNRCRCHASCWGFTPDEVFTGRPATAPLGELLLFDGQLVAHHFT